MKKYLALLLVCLLACSTAFATPATYDNTKAFLASLDAIDITYTVLGIEDGYEKVEVPNKGEGFSYTITYFFADDNEDVSIRVWDLIEYDPANFNAVVESLNKANSSYKWVKLYADTSDNTVTADVDFIVRPSEDVGSVVLDETLYLVSVLDEAYKLFSVYAK